LESEEDALQIAIERLMHMENEPTSQLEELQVITAVFIVTGSGRILRIEI